VLLDGILLVGVFSSLGVIGTTVSRYKHITKECGNDFFHLFENGMYIILEFLQATSYVIFTWDGWGYFNSNNNSYHITWYKSSIAYLLIILVSAFVAVPTAVVGHLRDIASTNACYGTGNWRNAISNFHASAQSFALFSTLVGSLYAVSIFYTATRKWKNGAQDISVKEWDGESKDLRGIVSDAFTELYNNYIEVGRSTHFEKKALKRWFVLMYFTYLTFAMINVVHLMLSMRGVIEYQNLDVLHSILNISIYVTAFFVPYYMAVWLNTTCQSCYRARMIDSYLAVMIKMEIERGWGQAIVATYLCKSGNVVEHIGCDFKAHEDSVTSSNECVHLLSRKAPTFSPEEDRKCRKKINEKYKEYCREVLVVQGTNILNLTKMAEFQFIPSVLNISIPLNSPAYILPLVLSLISIIYSFLR
jgi:hypothetical protein